jgi:hypothetical protein
MCFFCRLMLSLYTLRGNPSLPHKCDKRRDCTYKNDPLKCIQCEAKLCSQNKYKCGCTNINCKDLVLCYNCAVNCYVCCGSCSYPHRYDLELATRCTGCDKWFCIKEESKCYDKDTGLCITCTNASKNPPLQALQLTTVLNEAIGSTIEFVISGIIASYLLKCEHVPYLNSLCNWISFPPYQEQPQLKLVVCKDCSKVSCTHHWKKFRPCHGCRNVICCEKQCVTIGCPSNALWCTECAKTKLKQCTACNSTRCNECVVLCQHCNIAYVCEEACYDQRGNQCQVHQKVMCLGCKSKHGHTCKQSEPAIGSKPAGEHTKACNDWTTSRTRCAWEDDHGHRCVRWLCECSTTVFCSPCHSRIAQVKKRKSEGKEANAQKEPRSDTISICIQRAYWVAYVNSWPSDILHIVVKDALIKYNYYITTPLDDCLAAASYHVNERVLCGDSTLAENDINDGDTIVVVVK